MRVTPTAHLSWVGDIGGGNGTIHSAFASAPAALMTFGVAQRSASFGELGLGADFDLGDLLGCPAALTARYDASTGRDDIVYGAWTGRLTVQF